MTDYSTIGMNDAVLRIRIQVPLNPKTDPDPVAEFKEFERRFKFKPRLKYGWFHLKLY